MPELAEDPEAKRLEDRRGVLGTVHNLECGLSAHPAALGRNGGRGRGSGFGSITM